MSTIQILVLYFVKNCEKIFAVLSYTRALFLQFFPGLIAKTWIVHSLNRHIRLINSITTFTLASLVIPFFVHALPFNNDMVGRQPANGSVMRPNPENSISRGSEERYVGTREEAATLTNPITADERSVANGKRLFTANCSVCHGKYLDGKHILGAVSQQLPGADLSQSIYKDKPDAHFFQFIHFGGMAIMPAYGYKFSIKEHWDIVNYIRSVQGKVSK